MAGYIINVDIKKTSIFNQIRSRMVVKYNLDRR